MKKIITFIFVAFAWLILVNPVWAENFYIENYDVNMNVDKNKSVSITENIDVNFTVPSHGIYREIPFKNASISDISVSENYSPTYSPSNINLKIGDANRYISGPHHYTISYKYNYHDNKNEFYHNIIGTDWRVPIKKASYRITMPQDVDKEKVGISIGKYGTKGFNGGAWFSVNSNIIMGATEQELSPYEGITVRIEVPSGYFHKYVNYTKYYVISFMLILTFIAFMTWFMFGKDNTAIPVVNFYPPKGLNAIELEMAYKGKASTKGLVALLIELAQKGYIKIENEGTRFELYKSHVYDGVNKSEKDFLNALFEDGGDKVSSSDLTISNSFYKECQEIIDNVNKKRNKIFEEASIGFGLRSIMFLCLAGLLFLTVYTIFNYNLFSITENFMLLLFPLIAISVLVSSLANLKNGFWASGGIFTIIWALGFGGMPLMILISSCQYNSDTVPAIIIGIIGLIIAGVCTYQLPKRSQVGQRIYNNILGLKHFIEVSEKNRLIQLVEKDPQYFYSVLSAAYILGVSDKWINQFETIMNITPQWYSGNRFTYRSFNDFSEKMQSVSIPSVTNGGISSSSSGGGGFSGGGGGGGGGGSW